MPQVDKNHAHPVHSRRIKYRRVATQWRNYTPRHRGQPKGAREPTLDLPKMNGQIAPTQACVTLQHPDVPMTGNL